MLSSIFLASSLVVLVSAATSSDCPSRKELPLVTTVTKPPKPINESVLSNVRSVLVEKATHSWELGTETQAFIEYEWPKISVFDPKAFPPIPASNKYPVSDVIEIADRIIAQWAPGSPILIDGDGAAGDPPSLGIAVLYSNYSNPRAAASDAVVAQLNHLLDVVPRASNGAISHRESEVQLWDDFVAMVPPFIAYYGALHQNKTLVEIGYQQCQAYREILRDPDTDLWHHIMLGSWQDTSLWATGISWAAWGMIRVQQTLTHSVFARDLANERNDLLDWVTEIVLSAWQYTDDDGLLMNTLGCDVPADSFGDTASTSLMVSVTYRLAQICSQGGVISAALKSQLRGAVVAANKAYTTIATKYLTADGVLTGAVDPLSWGVQLKDGNVSPEGQAFVLVMEAARRDWKGNL